MSRPGAAPRLPQGIASYRNCLNGKLGEIWHVGYGLTLANAAGVDYVMNWKGQLAGISIAVGTQANAPIFAVDTGYFKERKVVQCAISGPRYLGALNVTSPTPPGSQTDNPRWFVVARSRSAAPGTDGSPFIQTINSPNYNGGSSNIRLIATSTGIVSVQSNLYVSTGPFNSYVGSGVVEDITVPRFYDTGLVLAADSGNGHPQHELRRDRIAVGTVAADGNPASNPENRWGRPNYFAIGSEVGVGGTPTKAVDASIALWGYATSPLTTAEKDALMRLARAEFLP